MQEQMQENQKAVFYQQKSLDWRGNLIYLNNQLVFQSENQDMLEMLSEIYRKFSISYPKFFKMDLLSKVAFLAGELLIPEITQLNKENIAVVLSTKSGCYDVDLKFEESRKEFASPALFVYTLPNIMIGELCIRHGFKGEQMCSFEQDYNTEWFDFYVSDLLERRGMEACLFGHVEAVKDIIEVKLMWVQKQSIV